jgi:hypothetical protein
VVGPGVVLGAALLGCLLATPLPGQNPVQTPTPTTPTAKEAREAKIAADAEKLYQMALDLKVEIDKSNKDTVSISITQKAAEIEKLAKILKQEMRAD